jgi:hypothetical protein
MTIKVQKRFLALSKKEQSEVLRRSTDLAHPAFEETEKTLLKDLGMTGEQAKAKLSKIAAKGGKRPTGALGKPLEMCTTAKASSCAS